jgi:hypothetical protein
MDVILELPRTVLSIADIFALEKAKMSQGNSIHDFAYALGLRVLPSFRPRHACRGIRFSIGCAKA